MPEGSVRCRSQWAAANEVGLQHSACSLHEMDQTSNEMRLAGRPTTQECHH